MNNVPLILQYIFPTLIASGLLFLTNYYAGKRGEKKTDADVNTIKINDEINLITFYKGEFRDIRDELEKTQAACKEITVKYDELIKNYKILFDDKAKLEIRAEKLAKENAEYKRRVTILEKKVKELELAKAATSPEVLAEQAHNIANNIIEQVKEQAIQNQR